MQNEARAVFFTLSLALAAGGASPARAQGQETTPGPNGSHQLTPACQAVLVRSVEHVAIEPGTPPKLVADGTVSGAGWTEPQLRFRSITKFQSHDSSALYAFVACPPEAGAEVPTPITTKTILNLAPALGPVKRIVIEAATNKAELPLDAPSRH
jgi:hypothetical protein